MRDEPCQATPADELRRQIMDSRVAKNEREHWAARRIDELESALENILVSSRWSGTPPTAYGKIARAALAAKPGYRNLDDECDRQMIVLALAKLTWARPGWKVALREIAGKLSGAEMFDKILELGPDAMVPPPPPGHPDHKPTGCGSLE